MAKYQVFVPELHYAEYVIEAESPEAAVAMVADTQGELMSTEYSHTLQPYDKAWAVVDESDVETLIDEL